jgi:hypothetical protein
MHPLRSSRTLALIVFASAAALDARAGIAVLTPVADNTLYEHETGAISNGKGSYLFTGTNGVGGRRRAVLRFDVASVVPAGATIHSASLQLSLSKTKTTIPLPASLHRLTTAWGEGASDAPQEEGQGQFAAPGDATWLHTFFPSSFWSQAGGDFAAAPSATIPLQGLGIYTWPSTPALVADVQSWLDAPASDYGWVVVGTETGDVSAKRFDSRESASPELRPKLRIEYTLPGECGAAVAPQQVARAGTPPNPLALLAGSAGTPSLGLFFDPRVDHASFLPAALADVLAVATASANEPSALGTLLVALAPPPLVQTRPAGAAFALYVPADCALAGAALFAQAGSIDAQGVIALTNALDLVVGSP